MLASVLTSALAALATPAEDSDSWLLVRSRADDVGGLSWQRIGEAYLGRWPWTVHDPGAEAPSPASSRFVVGTADDNPAIGELAADLGVELADGHMSFAGYELGAGTGLALVTDDPDGGGRLILFTGADAEGVYACMTISIDVDAPGHTFVRRGRRVDPAAPALDVARPSVVRLDRVFAALAAGPADDTADDVALRVARGLAGYDFVYRAALGVDVDLPTAVAGLRRGHAEAVDRTLQRFEDRDLAAEIVAAHDRCEDALGARDGPAPAYFAIIGDPQGTNAKVFGTDPVSGRPGVILNLCRFANDAEWEVAVLHETIHTLQPPPGPRLLDRALHEGVATYLTQRLRPGTPDDLALMWSDDELSAARRVRDEIMELFRAEAQGTNRDRHTPFLVMHSRPAALPRAPSRSGYYVGWLAAKAWAEAHPDRPEKDLLTVDRDEIFAALR